MVFELDDLVTHFGHDSLLLQSLLPELDNALDGRCSAYRRWYDNFSVHAPKEQTLRKLAAQYQISENNPTRLVFLLQTYYACVCKVLAAGRLGHMSSMQAIEDGSYFLAHNIQNMIHEDDCFAWHVADVDMAAMVTMARQFDYTKPPPVDALKQLYQDIFPRDLRHQLGEYYTPDWLAQHTLGRITITKQTRLLDPMCGSGTFVILAYRQLKALGVAAPLSQVAGIDINPLACLSAKANLILNLSAADLDAPVITLPIHNCDSLLNPPELGNFDAIVGNPPWINWETLPADYRQQTVDLWKHYNLFPHKGFESLLGKGKKDLSLVLTYAVVDRYLAPDGQVAFLMTQSVLKTGGAAEGFRQFSFPNHDLAPIHVEDFSKLRVFAGVATKPIVLVLGTPTEDPPRYYLWDADERTIPEDANAQIIETMRYDNFVGEPINGKGSAWLTGKPAAIHAVRKIIGESDYTAHAGVYTGGANAVYWLQVHAVDGESICVENITQGAKRAVPQVRMWIESEHVYPLLRGRDVRRWQATPSVHILIVQNPETRQGYAPEWLAAQYPQTYAYLAQFEPALRKRATLKRYFKDDVPFYTMFNVGDYTFMPYKVVWHGFGKSRMHAVVIGEQAGKPIMSNQAMHPFIGVNDADEAHYLAACLNSAPFEYAVLSHTQQGGKSFAQPGILQTLRIPHYDANLSYHRDLARLSRMAHAGDINDDAIAEASASVWNLSTNELDELRNSLSALIN